MAFLAGFRILGRKTPSKAVDHKNDGKTVLGARGKYIIHCFFPSFKSQSIFTINKKLLTVNEKLLPPKGISSDSNSCTLTKNHMFWGGRCSSRSTTWRIYNDN